MCGGRRMGPLENRQGGKTLLYIEEMREEMLSIPDIKVSFMMHLPPERRGKHVEVSPTQHGGIPIETEGRTSLLGLYSCGEAREGVDGASLVWEKTF